MQIFQSYDRWNTSPLERFRDGEGSATHILQTLLQRKKSYNYLKWHVRAVLTTSRMSL